MRYLRGRLLASSGDAAPREGALDFCPELCEHQRHLTDILTDTITGGQNNSVLLVGARGSGKTLVLDSALRQLREAHGDGVLPVRLNGMLHADERVAMREIAEQLCLGFKAEELEFSRAAGFAENVAFMREMLRVLENGRRGVVFVLEEFDLFAHRPKQTLLYAVMDLLQQTQVQAAVVGVTCRHDAAELLEKRVKSRFSSRRILLAPPVGRMRAATLVRHALSLPLPPPPPPAPGRRGRIRGRRKRGRRRGVTDGYRTHARVSARPGLRRSMERGGRRRRRAGWRGPHASSVRGFGVHAESRVGSGALRARVHGPR